MYNGKTVSIVFPAYNEEKGIEKAVKEFQSIQVIDKVYVINNNSKDNTEALARQAGALVINETKQGYGNALRRGLKEADTDYIVLCEPDATFIGKDINKLLSYASEFKMVMGTRTTRELIWKAANMGWFMRKGNYVVGKFLELVFNGPSLSDCGCTFRLIQKDLAKEMNPFLTVGASHFLPEMVILALLMEAPIIEIPLNYRGRIGESKITGSLKGTIITGVMMIVTIFRYWAKTLLGFRKKLPSFKPSDSEAPYK